MIIKVAEKFSEFPAGRYRTDGPFSGQEFREGVLKPHLDKGEQVIVVLDGARGYPSSFLEEAFGGLVRMAHFSPDRLHELLEIRAEDPAYDDYVGEIWEYINSAEEAPPAHQNAG